MTLMTANNRGDKHEIEVPRDQWGRPKVPMPSNPSKSVGCQRPSSLGHKITDSFSIEQWTARCIAKGAGLRPDLATMAATLDIRDDKNKLQKLAGEMKDAAGGAKGANTGTAIHTVLEKHLRGEPYDIPPVVARPVEAMLQIIEQADIRVVEDLIEAFVVCEDIPAAGSPDAYVTIGDGTPLVFDLKTGATDPREYSNPLGYAVQMAVYANATHSWGGVGTQLQPLPEIDRSIGVILWVPSDHPTGHAELIPLNLEAGWEMALLAKQVIESRRQIKRRFVGHSDVEPVTLPSDLLLRLASIRERLLAIDIPKADVIAGWPKGIPGLKPETFWMFDEEQTDIIDGYVTLLEES